MKWSADAAAGRLDAEEEELTGLAVGAMVGVSAHIGNAMIRAIPGARRHVKTGKYVITARDFWAHCVAQPADSFLGMLKPIDMQCARDNIVYFLQAAHRPDDPVKIGTSTAGGLRGRIAELQCGNPYALAVLAAMPGNRAIEADLHRRFAKHRLIGEWFEMHERLRGFIAWLSLRKDLVE